MTRRPHPGLIAAALLACQPAEGVTTAFTTTPTPTSGSTGDASPVSVTITSPTTSGAAGSSSASATTGEVSTSRADSSASSTEPILDVGSTKDLGDPTPVGCQGKIDFLFVISRASVMASVQGKLIAAFPKFIEAIEAKFADFDVHVMVVDGGDSWGLDDCTDNCPLLDCKVGQPCCPVSICPGCDPPAKIGDACCQIPDYPCGLLDLVTTCDQTMGAGSVFPAGTYASNKPCKLPGDRRYLASGDDLVSVFSCAAQVGISGQNLIADAMTAALAPEINAPGGCNAGFLRDDALLMITFIGAVDSQSQGEPTVWAQTLLDAKGGDPGALVLLQILNPECPGSDRICWLLKFFPHTMVASYKEADYGSIFDAAATKLVGDACAEYVPM